MEGLERVLLRLVDPTRSTRRTAAGRARLANDATTRALLEAGLRLLDAEFGGEPLAAGPPPARFFGLLSAARVAAAATDLGPLRATAAHVRDRWPRHEDYVDDLIAYGVAGHQWLDHLGAVRERAARASGRAREDVARELSEAALAAETHPVAYRLRLLAVTLAAARPAARAAVRDAYAYLDTAWAAVSADLYAGFGMPLRPDGDLLALGRAVTALEDGVNGRLLALGGAQAGEQDRRACTAVVLAGGRALAETTFAPSRGAPVARSPRVPPARPPAGASGLAPVLARLTDPDRGTRRTAAGRERLAEDPLTRQLLEGGLLLLDEEFRPSGRPPGDLRLLHVLSGARVAAAARAAGAAASAAQVRDRWATHDDYVHDLVSYALVRERGALAGLLARCAAAGPGPAQDPAAFGAAVAEGVLRWAAEAPTARLRLVVATLAEAQPTVAAALRDLEAHEADVLAQVLGAALAARGAALRDGVGVRQLAQALLALAQGVVVRALGTGEAALGAPLLLRAGRDLVLGSLRPQVSP